MSWEWADQQYLLRHKAAILFQNSHMAASRNMYLFWVIATEFVGGCVVVFTSQPGEPWSASMTLNGNERMWKERVSIYGEYLSTVYFKGSDCPHAVQCCLLWFSFLLFCPLFAIRLLNKLFVFVFTSDRSCEHQRGNAGNVSRWLFWGFHHLKTIQSHGSVFSAEVNGDNNPAKYYSAFIPFALLLYNPYYVLLHFTPLCVFISDLIIYVWMLHMGDARPWSADQKCLRLI